MDYPNTLGGFRAVFYVENNRHPTDQEIWDAGVRSAKQRINADQIIVTLRARIAELEATVDKLLQHCPDGECSTCGEIVCPYNEPFHFHHDGCPACAEAAPSPADSGEVKP